MSIASVSPITSGTWLTTNGASKLNLIVEGNRVVGTYQTGFGNPSPEECFEITGFVNDEIIGFVCSWKNYSSVTSWCGRYTLEGDKEYIKAIWHLGRMFSDKEKEEKIEPLFSFLTFSSTFRKDR